MTKRRIWELDALRGLCILGMVVFHLVYDMTELYALVDWQLPRWWLLVQEWGGVIFLLLSGLCAILGSRAVRRGATVFAGGMLCTLVTAAMAHLGMASDSVIIRFGVLHCLGTCMLLWPLLQRLPIWAQATLGAVILAAGWYFDTVTVTVRWLFPLGLTFPGFSSGDYFPLAPNLGWFLLGAVVGRTLYRRGQTLFPKADARTPVLRALCFCGRQSLIIYLLHQPVLSGILTLVTMLS